MCATVYDIEIPAQQSANLIISLERPFQQCLFTKEKIETDNKGKSERERYRERKRGR